MQDEPLQDQAQDQQIEATGAPGDPTPLLPTDLRGTLSLGLIAFGSVLMMIFVFRMLSRRPRTRGAATEETPRRRPGTPAPVPTNSHDRLEQLMADSEELTRRLAAILDNKAARLDALIQQADERLRLLEQAAAAPAPVARPSRPPIAEPQPQPPDPVDPLHRKVYELADQGLTPVDIARKTDRPTGQVELILALRRA